MQLEKILPLLTLRDIEDSKIIGELLVKNGFSFVEVTYRTAIATKVIKELSKIDGLTIGAGTVSNEKQMKDALDNGAKFIITPGINNTLIRKCLDINVPIYPGVITPSEIELCKDYGLKTLKLFPCGIFGGVNLIKSYRGPYQDIKFIPTGGINLNNAKEFLILDNVESIGGSFILKDEFINNKDWDNLDKHLKLIRNNLKEFI